jgi:hypothetical protein
MELYTAITGGKDPERNDIKCFTAYSEFKRPVMNAKIYKILAHKYLDTDISIWLDGNIFLLIPKEQLVKEFLGDADMAVWKHPDRDCLYEEGKAVKGIGGDYTWKVDEQLLHYRKNGFPDNAGLYECGVIIRRHSKRMEEFNEAWWKELCDWSCRDQISFPYVLRDFPDLKIKVNEGNVRNHPYFSYSPHTI